jgi:cell division protein FtsN
MARHAMPSASSLRLKGRRSAASKIFSALVLGLSVIIAVAGLGTAIYFQHAPELTASIASPTSALAAIPMPAPAMGRPATASLAPAPSEPAPLPGDARPAPSAAADAIAAAPPPSPNADLPDVAPTAGTSVAPGAAASAPDIVPASPPLAAAVVALAPAAPVAVVPLPQRDDPAAATAPSQPVASLEAPLATLSEPAPATPAEGASAAPRFWVEYAVYARRHYADNLQRDLAMQGLDAVVVRTHTPDGRPLLRVRSGHPVDRETAETATATARQSIKIVALIHRLPGDAGATIAGIPATPLYWVRLGSFTARHSATAARQALARHGIPTVLYSARDKAEKPLFYLRSSANPDRLAAAELAARAKSYVIAPASVRMSALPASRAAPHHAQDAQDAPAASHGPLLPHTG